MIFEHIISTLAPFSCLGCQIEGPLLCTACQAALPPSKNVKPDPETPNYMTATPYEHVAKDVVQALKFGRARAAADCIGAVLHDRVALPPGPWIITHIPTANDRVRLRGYDQAQLIARRFAAHKRVPYASLLVRASNARQVGANRTDRIRQAAGLFRATSSPLIQNARIILIDDVITTGASMHAASNILKEAGARAVYPVAFAGVE